MSFHKKSLIAFLIFHIVVTLGRLLVVSYKPTQHQPMTET